MTKNRPLDFRPRSLSAILLFVVVFVHLSPSADGLKCHQCSDYSGTKGGKDQCKDSKPTECLPGMNGACVKIWGKIGDEESVSRSCTAAKSVAEECVETEIKDGENRGKMWKLCTYLCDTDGCNSSPSRRSSVNPLLVWAAAIGATLAVLYQQQV